MLKFYQIMIKIINLKNKDQEIIKEDLIRVILYSKKKEQLNYFWTIN